MKTRIGLVLRLSFVATILSGTLVAQQVPGGGTPHRPQGPCDIYVQFGPAEVISQEFLLSARASYATLNVLRILGQEFLRRFDYLLDLKHHQLSFGAIPAAGGSTSFRLISGCMVLPTNLGPLMLDSGSSILFCSARLRTCKSRA
jgi:hypothetical protein